jgi:hypothetical protein
MTFGMALAGLGAAGLFFARGYWWVAVVVVVLSYIWLRAMADIGWRFLIVGGNRNEWTLNASEADEDDS